MGTKLGLHARMYYNSGTYAVPVWVDTSPIIRDATLNLEKGDADTSTRGSEWRRHAGTLKDASVDAEMLNRVGHAVYAKFLDSFLNNTPIDMLVLSGDRSVSGNDGIRAFMECMQFGRGEQLEEAQKLTISLMPALDDDLTPPAWVTTPI